MDILSLQLKRFCDLPAATQQEIYGMHPGKQILPENLIEVVVEHGSGPKNVRFNVVEGRYSDIIRNDINKTDFKKNSFFDY